MKDYDDFTRNYQEEAMAQGLTFDGRYIGAGCITRYTTQDVDDLYGRYMAEVISDNGYEIVYSVLVQMTYQNKGDRTHNYTRLRQLSLHKPAL